jgi:hypothetical protein
MPGPECCGRTSIPATVTDDSSTGAAPETSYTLSWSFCSRTNRLPMTLTVSASSTPASCTLVPVSLLVARLVEGTLL